MGSNKNDDKKSENGNVSSRRDLIMIIDDNEDILFNLELLLQSNNFDVITANSGKRAIELLQTIPNLPDVIISDILMPEMDGYEFYNIVSNNIFWNHIPFVFLTAKSSGGEIREGKLLGVDDYIVKPFKNIDLLAIIKGKITKTKRINAMKKRFEVSFEELKEEARPSLSKKMAEDIHLFSMLWDDRFGPKLDSYYPITEDNKQFLEEIGFQLFQTSVFLYGQSKLTSPEGILLNIDKIGKNCFVFFDSRENVKQRAKEQQFLLSLIAPRINYFESLKIKQIFNEISEKIKKNNSWNIKETWKEMIKILSEGVINFKSPFS